ncbi:MAG TPA: threonine/serine dehydratase [Terriglobales bacterium]|nr:threonine/serine dehydratase [Terriglobales bacterium]
MTADQLSQINCAALRAARERLVPYIHRTPLVSSATLGRLLGVEVYLKLEMFQKTGSFKVRGAFNKMLTLPAGSRVVAVSGGNHGQAVAYVGGVLGMPARVIMPQATPANYVAATRGYGGEVVLAETIDAAFAAAQSAVDEGWTLVHPFDDGDVIAGQGTVGLEILEDLPGATDVIVSVGGGGLATGVAVAVKEQNPKARMWGVETEGANCMSLALAAGKPVKLPAMTSIARTLGAPAASELTLAAAQRYFEKIEVVSDADTVRALYWLLERTKLLTEPAAACTLAAAERLKSRFTPNGKLVLVLCGGNLAVEDLCAYRTLAAGA